ncbi:MAG: apolipoprotein N-acyltransferase [Gammaproteobacteria bacterium]
MAAARGAEPATRRLADLAALAAGLCLPLAFAPFGLWPVSVLSPAVLFLAWSNASPRRAAWRGFLYGLGAFGAGTWWTFVSVHDFGRAPAALAAFLTVGLAAAMAAYYGALGWFARRFLAADGARLWLLGLPAAWTLTEWLRGWLFTGFPWLSLGYSQTDGPFAPLAPVGGVFGISWACALAAGALAALVRGAGQARAAAVVVLGALAASTALAGRAEWTEPAGEPLSTVMVQGAVGQDEKWLAGSLAPTRALYLDLSEAAWGADLVIWPEAAIPALLHQETEFIADVAARAREAGSALLLGILEHNRVEDRYHNILLALGDEAQIYRKRHLVPFGEFFPVPAFVRRWMRLMNLPYTDFAPGEADPPPLELAGVKVAPTICYEDAFGNEQRVFLPESGLLVNVSNDAWFGDTVAPHQHLQIARMRAMETGRWMLRATNNGISAVISPRGRLAYRSAQFVPEVIRAEVTPRTGATPWVRVGDGAVAAAAALAALAALRRRRGQR